MKDLLRRMSPFGMAALAEDLDPRPRPSRSREVTYVPVGNPPAEPSDDRDPPTSP